MAGRTMGIDLGDARLGIALSDLLGISVQPHSSLERISEKRTLNALIQLALQENVHTIVFGLPLDLSGEVGDQAKKVLAFVQLLQSRLAATNETRSIQVRTWDERLTSVQAERLLQGSKLKDKGRREARDRIAAAIILESYLASNSRPLA